MNKPTKSEYEKACDDVSTYSVWIAKSRNRIEELLDAICSERECQKIYMDNYKKAQEVKDTYEIYESVENENDNT